MQVSRREFGKLALAGAGTLAVGGATVPLEGCSIDITAAINTVLNSALAILKVAEPNATWTAALASAIAALQQAETSWQNGGAATLVIDALNTIEAVLAVIPVTAVYSPLIAILVAGIEAVMAAFGLAAQLSAEAMRKRQTIAKSPYYRMTPLHGPSFAHPTWQGAYRAQWNTEAVALNLPQAKI